MAGPIAHIVCALALLHSGALPIKDPKAFLIGTSFPDIRYLGIISREQTHKRDITWHDVQTAPSDFMAGMLLHSLVDRVREEYFVQQGMYTIVPACTIRPHTLKFLEDMVLYDTITTKDWQLIIHYFDGITDEERAFSINEKYIQHWHSILQRYFMLKPVLSRTPVAHLDIQNTYNFYPPFMLLRTLFPDIPSPQPISKMRKMYYIIHSFYGSIVQVLTQSRH